MKKFHRTKYEYLVDFNVIDTEFKAYFLGLAGADGNLCRRKDSVFYRINLQARDKELLEKLRDVICPNYKLGFAKRRLPHHQDQWYFAMYGSLACDALEKHGIVSNKTFILEPPAELPEHLVWHWLRGYWDGDGHISNRNKLVASAVGNYAVMKFISDIIRKDLGFATSVLPTGAAKFQTAPNISYVVAVWSEKAELLLHHLYKDATIYMERKKKTADEFLNKAEPNRIR